jgi:tagatose-1,6-bisphosphate aldolase
MTISPKACLVIVASVFAIKASAQKSTINKDTNGKLLYSYNKTIDNNNTSFDVRIIYKKDQVI